jgi:NAD(P)-dependent dehydrogenase (short-subunit alcohol dehydrogenase family)
MKGKGGSIVNVASVSGINPYPGASAYGASKAAIRLFSKIAAIECADAKTGVRVNVVSPSGVKTPVWESMDFFRELVAQHGGSEEAFAALAGAAPSHEFFTAEEIAQTILYLATDESAHLTGVELVIARGHMGSPLGFPTPSNATDAPELSPVNRPSAPMWTHYPETGE